MADGTIKSKLQLDGEKEYKKALNDAYRTLRVLRSELKAETAEMGKNASEQDKARAKYTSLQKQIEQQKKVVETLKKALADSKKEYAGNEEVQAKWEEKLNKARETLAKMTDQLDDAGKGIDGLDDTMNKAANSTQKASNVVVSFNDSLKSIGEVVSGIGQGIANVFTNSLNMMSDAVEKMKELMLSAMAAAGSYKDIQDVWGGSLEDIERVFTAAEVHGLDTGELANGINKLVSNTHNGNTRTLEALEKLGIEEKDYGSHWDYFVATMDAIAKKDLETRTNLAMDIFGDKKGAGMSKIANDWAEAMRWQAEDIADTGLSMTEKQIEDLDALTDKIQRIQTLWNQIKINIGAKLSEILNIDDLATETLNLLRDVGMILSGMDKDGTITVRLEGTITSILNKLGDAIGNLGKWLGDLGETLSGSDSPLGQLVGKLMSFISDALEWIDENKETIIQALDVALPFLAGNAVWQGLTGETITQSLGDLVKTATSILAIVKLIQAGKIGASAAASGAANAAAGAGAAGATGATATGSVFFTKAAEKLAQRVGGNVPLLAGGYDYFVNATPEGRAMFRGEGNVGDVLKTGVQQGWQNLTEYPKYWYENAVNAGNWMLEGIRSLFGGGDNGIVDPETENLNSAASKLSDAADTMIAVEAIRPLEESADSGDAVVSALKPLMVSMDNNISNLTSDKYTKEPIQIATNGIEAAVERGASRATPKVTVYVDVDNISRNVSNGIAGSLLRGVT